MNKSVIILGIIIVLSLVIVSAEVNTNAHDVTVTVLSTSPSIIYEYNTADIKIEVDNSAGSANSIINVTVVADTSNLTVTNARNPSGGWINTVSSNVIKWSNGSIDNDFTGRFNFTVLVNDLASTSAQSVTVLTTDDAGATKTSTITLNLNNDNLAPRYNLNEPSNYSIKKPQTTLFNISITEQESGLKTYQLRYDWSNTLSTTVATLLGNLTQNNGYYTASVDIGAESEDFFAYFFNLTDNADNNIIPQKWHYLFIDRQAPTVTLSTPLNNTIISQYTYNYGFSQGDNSFAIDNNFSPQSNCKLYINNSLKNSVTRSSNSTESLSASLTGLSDGTHEWYISCTDSAGWSTESSHATFILDTTGPVISLVSPENTIIANGTDITFTVSDSPSNVSSVWYSLNNGATNGSVTAYNNASTTYTINSSEQFTADTNNLIIYANDTKSNPSQKNVTFYVDVDPPSIELVSPVNDTFNSGSFRINATDNYASSITCQILIDGQVNATSSTSSKAFLNFNLNLSEGSHTWKITCTDLIGNLQTSATRIVKIDTTQPSIDPLYPLTVDTFNSLNGAADINYRLTETNPEKCILYVDNTEKSTVTAGTNFTNITFAASSQNSPFNWKVWCNDSAGNNNTSTTNSIYYDIINPVISNIANTSLSEDSVTISWSIDETSNNSLFYGANNALLAQKKVDTLGTSPTTSITGLSASTLYYFRVQSCDQFSHCINSSEYNVTTSAAPSTPSSGGGGGGGSSLNTCGVGYEKVNGKCILKEDKPEKDTECTPHWECSEWSSCSDGQQIRMCQDSSLCGKDDKPDEKQSCTEKAPTEEVVAIDEDLPAESDTAMDKIPLGVSAATGIFRQMKTNWKPITGIVSAIGILTILGSALFQRGPLAYTVKTVKEWKEAKMQKEEEEIREKLRNQGLIK